MLKISVIYDNTAMKKLKPAWGFAALVSIGKKNILFDTGGKADILLSNMKTFRISPKIVTDVFISHNHWDHAGGLFGFLAKNSRVRVFLPVSFSETYKREVEAAGAKCVRIEKPMMIGRGIYSTGPIGKEIVEQAMAVDTGKGLVVLTGCAHPGISKIVREAQKAFRKPVYAVLGGFHLEGKSKVEINKIIAEFMRMGVQYVGASHCTGERAVELFEREFGKGFNELGAGCIIDLKRVEI